MTRTTKLILVLVAASLAATSTTQAQEIASYDAGTAGTPPTAPAPSTMGFTLVDSAGGAITETDVSPDGTTGLNAWNIDDSVSSSGGLWYRQLFTTQNIDDAAANGWEMRVVMRMTHGADNCITFEYASGKTSSDDRYLAFLQVVGNDVLVNFILTGESYTCVNAHDGGYHEFLVRKDPGVFDAELLFDGTPMGTVTVASSNQYAPDGGIQWGAGSSGGQGGANWNQMSFTIASVEPGTGYCFGDPGSGTPCPCANDNDGSVPGSGCANGGFASGAKLTGSGVASISADTLVLSATGLDPNNSGLYFQANNNLSPGFIWGDGLQCAGGALKRLGVRFSDATGASDTSAWTTPISVWAGNVVAGDTKHYQLWYRDTSGGQPCGAGVNDFNSTNGYEVVWGP